MQPESLPDIFSRFNLEEQGTLTKRMAMTVFSEKNRLIKIGNNAQIIRAVQRIVNEADDKNTTKK